MRDTPFLVEAFWRAYRGRARFDPSLRALPPKLQLVASLALVEGLPYAEVADALALPSCATRWGRRFTPPARRITL